MKQLLILLTLLISIAYSAQCPRFDNSKSYSLYDCVYFEGSNGIGKNYRSEHNNNQFNPPTGSSTWWWQECSSFDDPICKSQYIDTTFIDSIIYDTVTIYDTVIVLVDDTIQVFDTIPLTIFDTLVILDTSLFVDTIKVDTLYMDTTYVINDTTYNYVPIDSFYHVGVQVPIVDSFMVVGFEKYVIEYIGDDKLIDSPIYTIDGKINDIKEGDEIMIKFQAIIYDNLGQYVNRADEERIIVVDEFDGTYEFRETFYVMEEELGHLRSESGRKLGTGVYIVSGFFQVLVNDEVRVSQVELNNFGHNR
jgi:hypothetical protein